MGKLNTDCLNHYQTTTAHFKGDEMKTRPLTENEINLLKASTELLVHKTMIEVLYRTGYRISELLSMKYDDVVHPNGTTRNIVTVSSWAMKGNESCRSVPLSDSAKKALMEYLATRKSSNPFLWVTSKGNRVRRQHFHYTLKEAAEAAGIDPDRVASHSFRKTFAKKIYDKSGNSLIITQKALGHKSITSTVAYLEFDAGEVERLILED